MGWWQREKARQPNGAETTRVKGQQAEDLALAYLQGQGLKLLARNYKTPGRGGGEIDLILRAEDGTVVFVEVRSRSHQGFGGAAQHWCHEAAKNRVCGPALAFAHRCAKCLPF